MDNRSKGQIVRANSPSEDESMNILIELSKMLYQPKSTSQQIIGYIDYYNINPDTYLPSPQEILMPLIFHCCSNEKYTDLFLYLLEKGVNIQAPMMYDDPEQQIELLYYSQIQYIPTLIKHGAKLDPNIVPINGEKFLIKGNISKLMVLFKNKAMTRDQLLEIIKRPNLIFRVLDNLYERIFYMCQRIPDDEQLRQVINEIMKNYINVFKLFFKNGVSVNQVEEGDTFVQRVLNTYLIDLIKLLLNYNPNFDRVELLHYSNFDLDNRQIMDILYNDEAYKQIQELLKDKIIIHKIVQKKPVLKRPRKGSTSK